MNGADKHSLPKPLALPITSDRPFATGATEKAAYRMRAESRLINWSPDESMITVACAT